MTQEPSESNGYLLAHALRLLNGYRHWTGKHLLAPDLPPVEQVRRLFNAPFVVLSHDGAADPILTYANRAGMRLFELTWEQLVILPSRRTAEPALQDERARLLGRVSRQGFIDDYRGVRISKNGRRFAIEQATVWNLLDDSNAHCGQAATFSQWRYLD